MIGYLRGKIKSIDFESVLVDVGGVGYGVHMSVRDVANLKIDQSVELLITEAVREQSYDLYGFFDASEKRIFDQLLKVNGVGPRIGLALLSVGRVNDLFSAISSEDISYLTQAPGVGKKMAEKMVIELRDKVPQFDPSYLSKDRNLESTIDAEAALLSLGFKTSDIKQMMDGVDNNLAVEEQIKQALSRK
jgi:Holliday junction DNA helicase RuvA